MQSMVTVNGVELCVETFGAPDDPAILLIAGMGGSMDWWDPELCARLADGGRYVIRYDLRDNGWCVREWVLPSQRAVDAQGASEMHVEENK